MVFVLYKLTCVCCEMWAHPSNWSPNENNLYSRTDLRAELLLFNGDWALFDDFRTQSFRFCLDFKSIWDKESFLWITKQLYNCFVLQRKIQFCNQVQSMNFLSLNESPKLWTKMNEKEQDNVSYEMSLDVKK